MVIPKANKHPFCQLTQVLMFLLCLLQVGFTTAQESLHKSCDWDLGEAGPVGVIFYGPPHLLGDKPEFELDFREFPSLEELMVLDHEPIERELAYVSTLSNIKRLTLGEASNFVLEPKWLKRIGSMKNLEELCIGGMVCNEGLKHLAGLRKLRRLKINSRSISDESLATLEKFEHLEELTLSGIFSDESVSHFCGCPKLNRLILSSPNVSDQFLVEIAVHKHETLTHLELVGPNIGKLGALALAECKQLVWVSLDSAGVSDDEVKLLAGLTELEFLRLKNADISDFAIESLVNHPSLNTLILDNTNVTVGCFDYLKKVPSLRHVGLANTSVSFAQQKLLNHFYKNAKNPIEEQPKWGKQNGTGAAT